MPVLNSDIQQWIDELEKTPLPDYFGGVWVTLGYIRGVTNKMKNKMKDDTPVKDQLQPTPLGHGMEMSPPPSVVRVTQDQLAKELNLTKEQLDALERLQDMEVIKRAQEDIARIAKKWGMKDYD